MTDSTSSRQSFGSRLAAVLAGELVNKGSVIVAFVWLARVLDPTIYGEVEWALSLTMVFTLVADAGLSTWGAAQVAARPGETPTIVARIGTLRLALAIPLYGIVLGISAAYGGSAGTTLAVYGLVLLLTPLFLQYVFNGLFQSRWAALGNAVRGVTFATVVLIFVREGSSPWMVAAAEVAGALALAVCSLLLLGRACHITVPLREGRHGLQAMLARSWVIGATEVTWGVHWYAGLILLGYLATTTDAAWHSAALRLVMAVHTGVWLYLYVLLPSLARVVTADPAAWRRTVEQSLRLTGWLGGGIALVGTLAAHTILTTVFGSPFTAAVPVLQAAIWVVPVAWMSGHLRYSLIAAQHPGKDYRAGLVGAGTTVVLSALLIPSLQSTGTGIALLGGTMVNAVAAWALGRRVLPAFAFGASVAASSACSLACLVLGLLLAPMTGELAAAGLSGTVLMAVALTVERDSARDILQTLTGTAKLKVGNADART